MHTSTAISTFLKTDNITLAGVKSYLDENAPQLSFNQNKFGAFIINEVDSMSASQPKRLSDWSCSDLANEINRLIKSDEELESIIEFCNKRAEVEKATIRQYLDVYDHSVDINDAVMELEIYRSRAALCHSLLGTSAQ